jgi:hypothetical protein
VPLVRNRGTPFGAMLESDHSNFFLRFGLDATRVLPGSSIPQMHGQRNQAHPRLTDSDESLLGGSPGSMQFSDSRWLPSVFSGLLARCLLNSLNRPSPIPRMLQRLGRGSADSPVETDDRIGSRSRSLSWAARAADRVAPIHGSHCRLFQTHSHGHGLDKESVNHVLEVRDGSSGLRRANSWEERAQRRVS